MNVHRTKSNTPDRGKHWVSIVGDFVAVPLDRGLRLHSSTTVVYFMRRFEIEPIKGKHIHGNGNPKRIWEHPAGPGELHVDCYKIGILFIASIGAHRRDTQPGSEHMTVGITSARLFCTMRYRWPHTVLTARSWQTLSILGADCTFYTITRPGLLPISFLKGIQDGAVNDWTFPRVPNIAYNSIGPVFIGFHTMGCVNRTRSRHIECLCRPYSTTLQRFRSTFQERNVCYSVRTAIRTYFWLYVDKSQAWSIYFKAITGLLISSKPRLPFTSIDGLSTRRRWKTLSMPTGQVGDFEMVIWGRLSWQRTPFS